MTEAHIRILEASEAKRARRSATLEELRNELERKHREALEDNPYGHFVSRCPIGVLSSLTPQEIEGIDAHERGAFDRHRPVAQAREQQRSAFIAAGGDAETFELNWQNHGRDAHVAAVASEQLQRVHRDDNVF